MSRKNRPFLCEYRRPRALAPHRAMPIARRRRPIKKESGAAIAAIAHTEGWLAPRPPIARVTLRSWQQAVLWGLRIYIAVMLMLMGWGIVHAIGR